MANDAPSEDGPGQESDGDPHERAGWTYFVMPVAILLASAIVAGAFWLTRGGDGPAPVAAGDSASHSSGAPGQLAASPAAAGPAGLLATFNGYAKQLGLDVPKFEQCLGNPAWTKVVNAHLKRGIDLGVTGTPTFLINNKLVVGSVAAAIYEEVIDAELKGSPTSAAEYSPAVQALAANGSFQILPSKIDVSDAPIEGSRDARVIVAEFSDFQCPFCKRFFDQALASIRKREGADVALAFLHFPIVKLHANAGNASGAAVCAADQGKFWQMHDLLFTNQSQWQDLR